jgi:hypothetical protein
VDCARFKKRTSAESASVYIARDVKLMLNSDSSARTVAHLTHHLPACLVSCVCMTQAHPTSAKNRLATMSKSTPDRPCRFPFSMTSRSDVRAEGWVCHVEMFGIDSPQEQLMSSGQAEPSQRSPFSAAPSVLGQSLIRMNNGEPTPETSYATPKAGPVGPERLGQNMTAELRGSTFTQALKIDYDGRKCLVFAFTDLSSTTEGTFVLRYRCFNLFAAASVTGQCPVVAEGIGDPFTVYSTRTFPGLGESTPLTKVCINFVV